MQLTFEHQKNLKAAAITFLLCLVLSCIFMWVKWSQPQVLPPIANDGIEVNLGNSTTGLGDVAPQIPGDPAPVTNETTTPPATSQSTDNNNIAENNSTNDNDIPVNREPEKVVKPITKPVKTPLVKKATKQPVSNNVTPTPPKPKALFKTPNGTGNGGNNADSYNNITNQGIAGGKGDQGSPNGNPNSDSYTGNGGTGKSGVSISKGLTGRRFTQLPSFEDDFNESAKVFVDITVNAAGIVTSATINNRGTTTTNANIRAIAKRKAMQLKLNSGTDDEQTGTILFNFKLKG